MKVALFFTFICLAAALPKARQVNNLNHPARVPGEYLIVLHRSVAKGSNFVYSSKVASKIAALSSKITILNSFTNLRSPILHVKTSDDAVMSQLFAIDEIESIDADMEQNMIEQCNSQATTSVIWGLSRVSSRSMPSYSGAKFSYGSNDGAGVRVYVLDTGVRPTHTEFSGRFENGASFVGGDTGDRNGHGTHCAGTVMGSAYGVSKAAVVVPVKVLGDSGSGSFSGIISGIDWMVGDIASRGIRGVGSMSLGGGGNAALDSAVNSADAAGVPVVVAAGNSNFDACYFSPARATGAITVGSTDIYDNLSSFSNYGSCVDILAPGSSILSASHLSDTGSRTLSGTSMACPHVAGLVANYLADYPYASTSQVKAYLTASSTQNVINTRGTSGTPNLLMYSSCA